MAYKTNYWIAFQKFEKSKEFEKTIELMKEKGIDPKYGRNILHLGFEAGWGDRKIKQVTNRKK